MSVLHTTRTIHTTFDKIPIRGNFEFDPATPYLGFGQGLYVKTTTRTFAPIAPVLPRGHGPRTSNTGRVKFWSQPKITIDNVRRLVIQPNPSFVHQEQDKVAW